MTYDPPRLPRDEQAALVAQWDEMAWKIAGTWFRRTPGADIEDVLQAARLGFVQAAARFDPTRGNQFSTYAVWYATNEVRKVCQGVAAAGLFIGDRSFITINRLSIDDPSPSDEGSTFAALIPDHRGNDESPFGSDWWDDALRSLPPRWADVVRLSFIPQPDGKNLTLRGIGRRLGISQERVRQIILKSVEKLRVTRPDLADYLPDGA